MTKTQVGNKMEIFITKYNTGQWHEEGNPLLVVNNLVSLLPPSYKSVQHTYEDWGIPIKVQKVYNKI